MGIKGNMVKGFKVEFKILRRCWCGVRLLIILGLDMPIKLHKISHLHYHIFHRKTIKMQLKYQQNHQKNNHNSSKQTVRYVFVLKMNQAIK